MTNYWNRIPFNAPILGPVSGYRTKTGFPLDTAFVLGASGKCIGTRFMSPVTTTIDHILFYLTAAPASAHDLSVNVCSQTGATQAGAAVANGTVAISGGTAADKWIKASYSSKPSVTVGIAYWVVIGDPSGAASEYSILSVAAQAWTNQLASINAPLLTYSSANGFSSAGLATNYAAGIVICFTDGTYLGCVYTTSANDADANVERGWKITPDEDVVVVGIAQGLDSGGSLKVYEDGQNPGGTIYSGFNGGSAFSITAEAVTYGFISIPPCTLRGGTTYRIVQDPSGTATTPGYASIEDDTTHSAILEACGFPGAFNMCHTEESGGAWTDSNAKAPRMGLLLQSNPAIDTPAVGNVHNDDTVRGAAGTLTLPTEAQVENGIQFGAGGTEFTGSLVGGGGGHVIGS